MFYRNVSELLEAYRGRRVNVLVKGYPPTERQATYAKTLAEMRCRNVSDEDRAELVGMVADMNREWTERVIETLSKHNKKSHRVCFKCEAEGNDDALS